MFGSNFCLILSASVSVLLAVWFWSLSFGGCSKKGFLKNLNTRSEVHLQDDRVKKTRFSAGEGFHSTERSVNEQFRKICCADDF